MDFRLTPQSEGTYQTVLLAVVITTISEPERFLAQVGASQSGVNLLYKYSDCSEDPPKVEPVAAIRAKKSVELHKPIPR